MNVTERSEETLSTRDLAQPNEPADRVAGDSTGDGAEEGSVYDQERVSREEPGGSIPGGNIPAAERAGVGPAETDRSGGAVPTGGDAARSESPTVQSESTAAQPTDAPADGGGVAGSAATGATGDSTPLLSAEASSSFQQRWEEVQTRFVDEPRGAVKEADGLVANLMQQLAEGFAQERERLEAQWGRGEDISTEDLRVTLQRYRSFFQRLLAA